MFASRGGKAIREIQCQNFEPCFIQPMTKGLLLVSNNHSVQVISKEGVVKYTTDKDKDKIPYPISYRNGSVVVGWVNNSLGMVTLKRYTDELKSETAIVRDQKVGKADLFYMLELLSGELCLCSSDRLNIFNQIISHPDVKS